MSKDFILKMYTIQRNPNEKVVNLISKLPVLVLKQTAGSSVKDECQ